MKQSKSRFPRSRTPRTPRNVYLDNAASTLLDPRARVAMRLYGTTYYANPGAIHTPGRTAARALEFARETIARKIGARTHEIIFTSGATESDNLALRGIAEAAHAQKKHVITSQIEHAAVLEPAKELKAQGFDVTYLPVDNEGLVNSNDVRKSITRHTLLVSIMHANNEIGTIEPIEKIGRICKEAGVPFHTDAAQSFAKVPIDVERAHVDLLSMSAHKIHGPKGVGALYVREGTPFKAQILGGGQEFGLRSGTQNVAGVVGFAKAAEELKPKDIDRMAVLRDYAFKHLLSIPCTRSNGSRTRRLCNNVNVLFEGVPSGELLMHLDRAGIAVSTGSACSSLDIKASHVLTAIGESAEEAHAAIRFSISKFTTKEEIDYAIRRTTQAVDAIRSAHKLMRT
ncbi:cysteine desulfurase [Candidatus Woesearchaeota archaeon]|nr:cysteine desulfurase [Candidatus Woesearchaeota archaeon]